MCLGGIRLARYIDAYINNNLHLVRKRSRNSSVDLSAKNFARAKLEENCELRGIECVQGQMFKHILKPNEGYCVCFPLSIFSQRTKLSLNHNILKQGSPSSQLIQCSNADEYHLRCIFLCLLEHIQSRDAFISLARERKYFLDYNSCLCTLISLEVRFRTPKRLTFERPVLQTYSRK